MLENKNIKKLIKARQSSKCAGSVLVFESKNPKGYGRIIKNKSGQLINIVEHKDANNKELKIQPGRAGQGPPAKNTCQDFC